MSLAIPSMESCGIRNGNFDFSLPKTTIWPATVNNVIMTKIMCKVNILYSVAYLNRTPIYHMEYG